MTTNPKSAATANGPGTSMTATALASNSWNSNRHSNPAVIPTKLLTLSHERDSLHGLPPSSWLRVTSPRRQLFGTGDAQAAAHSCHQFGRNLGFQYARSQLVLFSRARLQAASRR